MARHSFKKYDSAGVQGKDTYISFRVPSFFEGNEYRNRLQEVVREFRASVKEGKSEHEAAEELLKDPIDPITNLMLTVASDLFHDWNWKDDEGKALDPLVGKDIEEITKDLVDHEVYFISECVSDLIGVRTEGPLGKLTTGR